MVTPTLSLTQSQALIALRSFLVGVLPSGTPVVLGQVNRVPEPIADNFVVMTPVYQARLETNEVTYQDNVIMASIAAGVLTVIAISQDEGPLTAGQTLTDGTAGLVATNTVIGNQISGTVGGIGTYAVSPPQTVASETMYAGMRLDLVGANVTVQLDVHGSVGGNNARVIEALYRSEYATSAFAASGYDVAPLYCEDPRQIPFINAEQQYEDRWIVEACMQVNPVVGTPQQFAAELDLPSFDVALIPDPSPNPPVTDDGGVVIVGTVPSA